MAKAQPALFDVTYRTQDRKVSTVTVEGGAFAEVNHRGDLLIRKRGGTYYDSGNLVAGFRTGSWLEFRRREVGDAP